MSPPALRARQGDPAASFDDGMWHPPTADTPPVPVVVPPTGGQPETSSASAMDSWPYQAEGVAVPDVTPVATPVSTHVSMSAAQSPPPTSTVEQQITGKSAPLNTITEHISSPTAADTQAGERLGATESSAFVLPLEPAPISTSKPGFKITYLTPLFVIVGVMLGVMVATWIWGRWVRRRGRTNSVTGSTHSDDFRADENPTAYLYGGLSTSTNTRYAGGTRRVSARRDDSYEDFKLLDEKENYSQMPPPGTKPRYGTDSEEECVSEHPTAHRERAVRGWVKTVRSPRTFTSSTLNRSPRSAVHEVEVFRGREASIAPSDSPSGRRHGMVYPTSPRSTGTPTCEVTSRSPRLPTPMSYLDEDSFYSQDTAHAPLVQSVPPLAGSRHVLVRDRPTSKHSRVGSVASDGSDGFHGVRRSVLEHTQLLKDEDSIDDYTMESTDEDEWSATSPTSPHSPPRNTLHTIMESTQASPAIGGALASMRLSAAIAQDRRHSSAISRRSRRSAQTTPGIVTSNSANNLLMRLKDRLEKRSAARSQQFTVASPTPSEAQIGSAFRTPGSSRPPPPPPKDVPRMRLPAVDSLKRIPVLNASAISLELRTPPPRSQLVVGSSRRGLNTSSISNSSATPSEIRRGQVRAQTRHVRVSSIGGSQDAPSIRLEHSHSRSASLSSSHSRRSSTSGREPPPPTSVMGSRLTPTSSQHRPSGLPTSKLRRTPSPSPSPSYFARKTRSDSIESDGSPFPSRVLPGRNRVTDAELTSRAPKRLSTATTPLSINTWAARGGGASVERAERKHQDSAPRQRCTERSHGLGTSTARGMSLIPGNSSLAASPVPRARQPATSSRVARPRPSGDNIVASLTIQKYTVRRAPSPNRVDEMLADTWASNKI